MFKKGQSGNPGGRNGKPFLAALQRAVLAGDGESLRKVADKLVRAAEAGEPWAIQMLADRLDGKARQEVEHSSDPENPVQVFVAAAEALRNKIRGE